MTKQQKNLIAAFGMFPEYSYKQIARVMGVSPVQVAILRNAINRHGGHIPSRHIS